MRLFRRARGFTLMWAIVVIAVMAAIAAAAAPYIQKINDNDKVQTTAATLARVAAGVRLFNVTVTRGVARTLPMNLNQLWVTIVVGQNSGCTTNTFNAGSLTTWSAGAPFITTLTPTTGVWTPMGLINNLPSSSTATVGTVRTTNAQPFFLQIQNADADLVTQLDNMVDGTINGAAGLVQYTTPVNGLTLLSYDTQPTLPAC